MATIVLPPLPYEANALEPYISANTLGFHHGKHHQTYVTNLVNLIQETSLMSATLEEIVVTSAKNPEQAGIFNNAAQVWNHTFYWHSMKKDGGGKPSGEIAKKIDEDFGSYDAFAQAFKNAGLTQFGSGWAWLVLKGGKLEIMKTPNADTPLAHGVKAILTMDVWEHAYYLDYQNKRADYIDTFLNHLVNWDFANANLAL